MLPTLTAAQSATGDGGGVPKVSFQISDGRDDGGRFVNLCAYVLKL
jgi:hypothetical protein